jgi:heat-inducible transcriptional repressor
MELSQRQSAILRALIERYIVTATPVASETLARNDFASVSSATIRNELAVLEDAALIYHPHTSAGRIPTERGYRFFVEHLLSNQGLSPEERRTILHQFAQVQDDVDEWLRLASAALATASGVAAIVSGTATDAAQLRHVELIPISSQRTLVVATTDDASVHQHIVETREGRSPEELRTESARLSTAWADMTAAQLRQYTPADERASPQADGEAIRLALCGMLERQDQRQWEIRYHDGLANVLSQPEYYRSMDELTRRQRVRLLLAILEHGEVVRDLLPGVARAGNLRVVIGDDHSEEMRDISLILCPYGDDRSAIGVVGVVGPMRLDYRRAISGTRYVASILSSLLRDWHGHLQ